MKKDEWKLIFLFGVAYSCVIGFALFGPLLGFICMGNLFYATSLAMIAFMMAFIQPERFSKSPKWIVLSLSMSLLMLAIGPSLEWSHLIAVFLIAYGIANICRYFTLCVYKAIDLQKSEKVMAYAFMVAFSILYFINMIYPLLSRLSALILLCLLTTLMYGLYFKVYRSNQLEEIERPPYKMKNKGALAFISLYLVYIGGGISYAGIYPYLEKFASIDRFYNVLPLILALPIAGKIGQKRGNTYNLLIGILSLSVAFAFFLLPLNVINYFIVQSFLQVGWAFVNVWGFSYSWHLADQSHQASRFGYGIIFILLGVLSGSLIANRIIMSHLGKIYFGPISFVPLITTLIFQLIKVEASQKHQAPVQYKEVVKYQPLSLESFNQMAQLDQLTSREKEVLYYYYLSDTAKTIAEKLYISPNTVRTHIKKAYSKLDISNRNDLKKMIDSERQARLKMK